MNKETQKVQCPFCGSARFEQRRIEYLYSYEDKYLLVPNTPVEICVECGMTYYDAFVLEEIERRFFAIHQNNEKPDRYVQLPIAIYA
jgi:YgiT-type zinc finger domain-containing protein